MCKRRTYSPLQDDGLDPEYTNAEMKDVDDNGVGADLKRGIDMGGWPSTRRFLFGVNFAF